MQAATLKYLVLWLLTFSTFQTPRTGKNACATTMQIRHYKTSDLRALQSIHQAQGFDYPLPDLTDPLFTTKIILTDSDFSANKNAAAAAAAEKIRGAAFLRLTAEAYLLLDPSAGTPHDRWRALLALHAATEREAWQRGLEDVHAWLPPPIAKKFGKRIAQLGWQRDDTWTPYCKKLSLP